MRTSIQIVADLLVVAQSVDDEGGIASRHGMMLARSDLGVPDAALMGQLVSLLATTEGLRLVAPKELVSNVVTLLRPGGSGEVTITLPDQAGADLSDRVDLIQQISGEIFAFASMLSDGAQQVEQWGRVLDALPSTAVDDQTAAAMVAGLRKQFDVYRTGIQGPAPFTFTLTGRSNTVTFSLTNTTDTELKVRVRLSSPKLTFPDGDEFEVLPPGAETEINVRAGTITCPAGEVESFEPGDVVHFDPEACGACPLRAQCTHAATGRGRTVTMGDDEGLQKRLRKLQSTRTGREKLRERVPVEHRLAHLGNRQGRRARR